MAGDNSVGRGRRSIGMESGWIKMFGLLAISSAVLVGTLAVGGGWLSDDEHEFESPLSDYVGFRRLDLDFSVGDATRAIIADARQRVEEDIAECMAAEGLVTAVTDKRIRQR